MNSFLNPKRLVMAGALAGALATGAVIGAVAIGSVSAATSTPSPSASTSGGPSGGPSSMPPHGSQAHESAETPVTGANATKAQAAAVKYVGSGTAGAVTTDFTKTGYEVTVTKSDGSTVEVHLNSSFTVEQGGPGGGGDHDGDGPGGPGGPGGPPANG